MDLIRTASDAHATEANAKRIASGAKRPQGEPEATPNRSQTDRKPMRTRTASAMKLTPPLPPGRSNRKTLAFAEEIARLVAQGYSAEAIRRALADAGVVVSKSTVRREVVRARARWQPGRRVPDAPRTFSEPLARTPAPPPPPVPVPAEPTTRTGREIAEDFFRGRIDNPLIRARSTP